MSKKKYRRNAARNLTALALSPALDYRIGEQGSLRIGVTGARENSGLAIYKGVLVDIPALRECPG